MAGGAVQCEREEEPWAGMELDVGARECVG